MKIRIIYLSVISILLATACNKLEKKLEGTWAVDQAYYHDEPVIWDLYTNAIKFNYNHTCNLPPVNTRVERTSEEEKGTWKILKENDKTYIQINSGNRIFNRTFQIHNLRRVQDTISWGNLMKMTLTADSLKIECTKALFE